MPELSPREVEVLQCVAAGKSNKENGAKLFRHSQNPHEEAFRKIDAVGRTAAIREAVRRGLVRLN